MNEFEADKIELKSKQLFPELTLFQHSCEENDFKTVI